MRVIFVFALFVAGIHPREGEALTLNEIHYITTFKSNSSYLSSVTIELYNNVDSSVSLSYYALRLNLATQPLPATQLLPHRHFIVTIENIDMRLGQPLELVEIFSNLLVDSVTSVGLTVDESYGRVPDGTGAWSILKKNSLGWENTPDYSPDDYNSDWIPYAVQAPFGKRDGAGAVVFQGEMWLLGGWAHGPVLSDIWKSKNGVDWEYVTYAPWPGRHQFGAVVFKEKIWVVGGDMFSDVWSSEDGVTWSLETDNAPWGDRYAPYVCTFDDKLWIMGGQKWENKPDGTWDYTLPIGLNDVWYSSDGVNWEQATASAPWKPRSMINGSVVFQGKMWILGGGIKGDEATTSEYNDVWNSVDGVNWELITDSAGWKPRVHLSTIVYNDKIWVTDGSSGTPSVLTNEVWSSEDGVNWSEVKTDNRWNGLHASSLFNYDGSLWVVAGFNSDNVWRYSEAPTHYFSRPTGLLSDLTTWTTGADGTGENPQSFDRDNQVFVVANRDSVVLSDGLRVQGRNSKIIIGTEADSVTLSLEEKSVLDALVDVSSTSSLVIGSGSTPSLNKLHAGSTVIYARRHDSPVSSTAYYNLSVAGSKSYTIHGRVVVYGTLNVGTASLNAGAGGVVDAYGDVVFKQRHAFSSTPLRFSGSGMQIINYPDSAVFFDTSIDKVEGMVEMAHGQASFNRMSLRGGSLIINEPITIHSPIDWNQRSFISTTEVGTITVECSSPGEYVLPVKLGDVPCPLMYSAKSASVITAGLVKTDNLLAAGRISLPQSLKHSWYISSDVGVQLTLLWDLESQDPDFRGDNIAVDVLQGRIDTVFSISSPAASINYDLFPDHTLYFTTVSVAESTTGFFVISDKRRTPNFTFALPTEIRYGERIPLEVKNDAGLPMQYSVEGSVELVDDSLFARAPGPFTLSVSTQPTTAFLSGAATYRNEVYRAQTLLQFDEIPKQQLSQGLYRLMATSSSSAPIQFKSENENIAIVWNHILFFRGAGKTTITADQDGTELFESASATEIVEITYDKTDYDKTDTFVLIYPNPSAGRVTLQVHDPFARPVEINILGEFGQSVYKTNSQDGNLYEELNLDNGLYILVVTTKDGRSVRKIIISR